MTTQWLLDNVKKLNGSALFISDNTWVSILDDAHMRTLVCPENDYNTMKEGRLGQILGIPIYSDMFKHSDLRILSAHDVYLIPQNDIKKILRLSKNEWQIYVDTNAIL